MGVDCQWQSTRLSRRDTSLRAPLRQQRLSRGPGGGIPSSTLRGFFSNEENAQNFLYATAIISFSCKHDVCVNFAQNQPKIGLFCTRFQGLGTPGDSCGLNYALPPLFVGVEPRSTP